MENKKKGKTTRQNEALGLRASIVMKSIKVSYFLFQSFFTTAAVSTLNLMLLNHFSLYCKIQYTLLFSPFFLFYKNFMGCNFYDSIK